MTPEQEADIWAERLGERMRAHLAAVVRGGSSADMIPSSAAAYLKRARLICNATDGDDRDYRATTTGVLCLMRIVKIEAALELSAALFSVAADNMKDVARMLDEYIKKPEGTR